MLVNFSEEWAVLICRTGAFFMMVDGDVSISESFISTVILADDTLTPEENIAFRKWKHHYKLAF